MFPHLLTLLEKEKSLNTKAVITNKRPAAIGQKLKNYKHFAKTENQTERVSGRCKHCALCACHGKHNKPMVSCVSQIMTKI